MCGTVVTTVIMKLIKQQSTGKKTSHKGWEYVDVPDETPIHKPAKPAEDDGQEGPWTRSKASGGAQRKNTKSD